MNHRVHLPLIRENVAPPTPPHTAGNTEPPRFPFLAGQPQEVIDDMRRVWAERGAAG